MTPEEPELAAAAYETAAQYTSGPLADASRAYNLARAQFLRGQIPSIPGTLREFMAEHGYKMPGD